MHLDNCLWSRELLVECVCSLRMSTLSCTRRDMVDALTMKRESGFICCCCCCLVVLVLIWNCHTITHFIFLAFYTWLVKNILCCQICVNFAMYCCLHPNLCRQSPILNQGKDWDPCQPHNWSFRASAAPRLVTVPLLLLHHVHGTVCSTHCGSFFAFEVTSVDV